jgi:hypothetical protein
MVQKRGLAPSQARDRAGREFSLARCLSPFLNHAPNKEWAVAENEPIADTRARIEAMLAELADERLLGAWMRVCPIAPESAPHAPDRRGIIRDLADLAEALQPKLAEMTAEELCRQIERYGCADGAELLRGPWFTRARQQAAEGVGRTEVSRVARPR